MFCHVQICTLNVHINICFCMGFRHVHVCTNDYPYYSYGFSSCTSLYEWPSISLCMGFCHAHFCTNDYPFLLNGFSSCKFLYEWLSISFEWVFIMHISLQMTVHFFMNGFSSWTFLYEWLGSDTLKLIRFQAISLSCFCSRHATLEWPFEHSPTSIVQSVGEWPEQTTR